MPDAVRKKTRVSKKKPAKKSVRKRTHYHHGNLRQALIDATLRLIEEGGGENVTVRDAARRAGVSSGAPFRHFPNRKALMAAVAQEAFRRFRAEIAAALEGVKADDPLARLRAMANAYMRWAIGNPTYFRIISTRNLFDFQDSAAISRDNDEIIGGMEASLAEAARRGTLRTDDLHLVKLAGRALVYGLARMYIDGQLPRWGVAEHEIEKISPKVIDLFMAGVARMK